MRVNESAQVFVTYLQYIEEAERTKSWQQLDNVALRGRARFDGCCRIGQGSGIGQEGTDRPLADAHALEFGLVDVVGEKVLGTHGGSFYRAYVALLPKIASLANTQSTNRATSNQSEFATVGERAFGRN
jgi:hypothetical protein